MNLLIVNDEIRTADMTKECVNWQACGIENVFISYNAEQAKEYIKTEKIHILLCDIEMPGESGIELLRWVRERRKDIACIFLTCHASFDYAREAIELGCQNYLLMPAKYETIQAEVEKVVKGILEKQQMERYQQFGRQVIKDLADKTTENWDDKKAMSEIIMEVKEYIASHLKDETLSVNDLADKYFLHPVYLNRVFKKEEGISVGKYIMQLRMGLAAELLKSKKMSATAVAEEVGYISYPTFSMMFKKYHGCSPSQMISSNGNRSDTV